MTSNGTAQEIKELNLAYLLLAQRMIAENEVEAMFRLGMSREIAAVVAGLSPSQMVKLSQCNAMLCRLRLDATMLEALAHPAPPHDMQSMHAAILLASQPVEADA